MQEITTSLQDAVKTELIRPNERPQSNDQTASSKKEETESRFGPDVIVNISDSAKDAQSVATKTEDLSGLGTNYQGTSQVTTTGDTEDTNGTYSSTDEEKDNNNSSGRLNDELNESIVGT